MAIRRLPRLTPDGAEIVPPLDRPLRPVGASAPSAAFYGHALAWTLGILGGIVACLAVLVALLAGLLAVLIPGDPEFPTVDPVGSWTADLPGTSASGGAGATTVWTPSEQAVQLSGVVDTPAGPLAATLGTSSVSGSMIVDDAIVRHLSFQIAMDTLVDASGQPLKGDLRSTLGLDEHPTASFTMIEPAPIPSGTLTGATHIRAVGELTLRGVARIVVVDLELSAGLDDSLGILWADQVDLAQHGFGLYGASQRWTDPELELADFAGVYFDLPLRRA